MEKDKDSGKDQNNNNDQNNNDWPHKGFHEKVRKKNENSKSKGFWRAKVYEDDQKPKAVSKPVTTKTCVFGEKPTDAHSNQIVCIKFQAKPGTKKRWERVCSSEYTRGKD